MIYVYIGARLDVCRRQNRAKKVKLHVLRQLLAFFLKRQAASIGGYPFLKQSCGAIFKMTSLRGFLQVNKALTTVCQPGSEHIQGFYLFFLMIYIDLPNILPMQPCTAVYMNKVFNTYILSFQNIGRRPCLQRCAPIRYPHLVFDAKGNTPPPTRNPTAPSHAHRDIFFHLKLTCPTPPETPVPHRARS